MSPLSYVTPWLRRLVAVRDEEVRALFWSFAYFFLLLTSYYVIRPLRDEMGIQGGVRNLPWLFTATFLAMVVAVPLFGTLVARLPRRRIVPVAYRFFSVNILIFFGLFQTNLDPQLVARAFFVWTSVFNLFVVSVFWSFMADLFEDAAARRLFGFVAVGGSLGALTGPGVTALLVGPLGPVNLLLVSAVVLELAIRAVRRLLADRPPCGPETSNPGEARAIGGTALAGFRLFLRSPYLLGIALFILLYTGSSTFLYFQQAEIVAGAFDDPAARTRLFALIDLGVGLGTIAIQMALTGRVIAWLGLGPTLALLPLVTALGFLALALEPTLAVLVVVQIARRASNYGLSRPAREVLFTVLEPEGKYKAKNLIDTLVYRGGDALVGWVYAGLARTGVGSYGPRPGRRAARPPLAAAGPGARPGRDPARRRCAAGRVGVPAE